MALVGCVMKMRPCPVRGGEERGAEDVQWIKYRGKGASKQETQQVIPAFGQQR